jgi:glycosyltransferase involved in cell wall biosynthesis
MQNSLVASDICVITTIHPPWDARIYFRETVALAEAGFQVVFISTWPEDPHRLPNLRWVTTPTLAKRTDRLIHGFRTFRAALRERPRAYHFHDLDFLPWAILLKWVRRVPVVYDCHENYPEEILHNKPWIPPLLRRFLAGAVRRFESASVRILHWVIVPVPSLRAKFEAMGASCTTVRNVANLLPRPDLAHEPGLLYLGSLSESYGLDTLLEIMRQLKAGGLDLPLIVTDKFGSPEIQRRIEEAVEKEGLAIRVMPRISANRLDEYARLASIALATEQPTPERILALPTKLFEYMAYGLPMVASDLPLTREVVERAGCGILVPPADAGAYVEAILRLHADESLRREHAEAGFAAVEGEYSWDQEKRQLQALFRSLLAS